MDDYISEFRIMHLRSDALTDLNMLVTGWLLNEELN